MADAVAVLGLGVDNSGALVALKQFDDATKRTASTATTSATQIEGATRKVVSAVDADVKAIQAQERAQNRAANERARAAVVMRDYEIAQRAVAQQEAIAAARARVTATAADGTDAAFKRMKGSVTSLASAFAGTNATATALSSTIGSLALGNALTVGVLAGVAAIGLAYDKLTEKSRKLKEAQNEAIKAIEALAKAQRLGIGGELAEQIGLAATNIAKLRAEAAALTAARGSAGGGAGPSDHGGGQRGASDVAEELKKRNVEIAAAERALKKIIEDANKEASSKRTAELAALRVANALTVTEQASLVRRLGNLKGQLAENIKLAGDPAERLRLIEGIKALTAETDAAKASAKSEAAAKRDTAAAARDAAKALREQVVEMKSLVQWSEIERTIARKREQEQVGIDAVEKLDAKIEARKKIAKLDTERYLAAQNEIDALQFQVDLIGKTKAEQEGVIDAENKRLAGLKTNDAAQIKAFVDLQRRIRENKKDTDTWADSLQSIVGIVQLIASAFGDAGKEIAKAATGAQSILSGLDAAKSIKDAAGNGVSFGKAIGGSAGFGAQAAAIGSAGAVLGGVLQLADALDIFGDRARERAKKIREDAEAFKRALDEYLIVTRTSLEEALRDNATKGADIKSKRINDAGFINNGREAQALVDDLKKLDDIMRQNDATIRARFAQEEKAALADIGVRTLRAAGLTAEAEALKKQIANEKELADARSEEVRAALRAVQALEAVSRALAKLEEERRNIFDLTNATQAFTDPRGAGQAAFDEAAMRRYNDAVTRGASAAELAAIALYNIAAAADRAAQLLEADTRTTEGLVARILGTLGDDRATQDFTRTASNRQELADAIRSGMSESNIALLRFAQFAEGSFVQMQRAIEDGTKAILDSAKTEIDAIDRQIEATQQIAKLEIEAIEEQIDATQAAAKAAAKAYDDQISAIREQTKAQLAALDVQRESARDALEAANRQVSMLDKAVQTNQRIVDEMRALSDSLTFGPLSTQSPTDQLAIARAQFEATSAAARGGNAAAAADLPNTIERLLRLSRDYNASGPGFVSDADKAREAIAAVTALFGTQLSVDQQALAAAQATVTSLQATLEALDRQRDVIGESSDAQIDAIQKLKEKAAEDAQRIIDELVERKEKISADANATIDKLQATKEAIETAAQNQINLLIANETAAHADRLRKDSYWQTFLGLGNGGDPAGGGNSERRTPATGSTGRATLPDSEAQVATRRATEDVVAQLRATNLELQGQITVLQDGFLKMLTATQALTNAVTEGATSTKRAIEESATV